MQNEVIWITGATSGIGRELAIQQARIGHTVIASGRREALLKELHDIDSNIHPLVFDVCDRGSLADITKALQEISPYLDRVVVNAGHCEYMAFPNPDWQMARRVMEVNYFGSINTIEAALPLLRSQQRDSDKCAHIIGIVSQVTSAPFSRAEAYGASKAAFEYFLNCLRIDLASENIDVTVIKPGFVTTPMTAQNDFPMPYVMDADSAAEKISDSFLDRPRTAAFPKRLTAVLKLSDLVPGLWQKAMQTKQQ